MISSLKELVAGWPLTSVPRIAATCLAVATDPDPDADEKPWMLPDGGEVERIDWLALNEGFYKELNERLRSSLTQGEAFEM